MPQHNQPSARTLSQLKQTHEEELSTPVNCAHKLLPTQCSSSCLLEFFFSSRLLEKLSFLFRENKEPSVLIFFQKNLHMGGEKPGLSFAVIRQVATVCLVCVALCALLSQHVFLATRRLGPPFRCLCVAGMTKGKSWGAYTVEGSACLCLY